MIPCLNNYSVVDPDSRRPCSKQLSILFRSYNSIQIIDDHRMNKTHQQVWITNLTAEIPLRMGTSARFPGWGVNPHLMLLDPSPKFSFTPHSWFSQKYIKNTLLTPWFYHKSNTDGDLVLQSPYQGYQAMLSIRVFDHSKEEGFTQSHPRLYSPFFSRSVPSVRTLLQFAGYSRALYSGIQHFKFLHSRSYKWIQG